MHMYNFSPVLFQALIHLKKKTKKPHMYKLNTYGKVICILYIYMKLGSIG